MAIGALWINFVIPHAAYNENLLSCFDLFSIVSMVVVSNFDHFAFLYRRFPIVSVLILLTIGHCVVT